MAPALRLARLGFDVWLGNQRGTTYSMDHEYLSSDSKEFWDFSWQEMGDFDQPAQLQFALSQSGRKNLTYIGHSQGSTQMFYSLSAHPEFWSDKINLFVALSPVASMQFNDHWFFSLTRFFIPFYI